MKRWIHRQLDGWHFAARSIHDFNRNTIWSSRQRLNKEKGIKNGGGERDKGEKMNRYNKWTVHSNQTTLPDYWNKQTKNIFIFRSMVICCSSESLEKRCICTCSWQMVKHGQFIFIQQTCPSLGNHNYWTNPRGYQQTRPADPEHLRYALVILQKTPKHFSMNITNPKLLRL